MKIELDDRGGAAIASPPVKLTCHGAHHKLNPDLPCGAKISTGESEYHGYAQARCGNCGRWGITAWEIATPGAPVEHVIEAMHECARELWETKPTTTYGDL